MTRRIEVWIGVLVALVLFGVAVEPRRYAWGEDCDPGVSAGPTTSHGGFPKYNYKECNWHTRHNTWVQGLADATILNAHGPACIRIEDAASVAGVNLEWFVNASGADMPVLSVMCHCHGTCTTKAQFDLKDRANGTISLTSTLDCGTGTAVDVASLVDTGDPDRIIAVGDGLKFYISNTPSPSTDDYLLCVRF